MIRSLMLALLVGGIGLTAGCDGRRRTEDIPVKASNDPLEPARMVLNRYAEGQPVRDDVQLVARAAGLAKIAQRPPLPVAGVRELLGVHSPVQV